MCFAFKCVFVFSNGLLVIVLVFNFCSFRYYPFNYYLVVSYFTFLFIYFFYPFDWALDLFLFYGLILSPIYRPTFRPNLRPIQARGQLKSRGHEQPSTGPTSRQPPRQRGPLMQPSRLQACSLGPYFACVRFSTHVYTNSTPKLSDFRRSNRKQSSVRN